MPVLLLLNPTITQHIASTDLKVPKWSPVLLWLFMTSVCFAWAYDYSSKPAESGSAPESWPMKSVLPFDSCKKNLLVFVHPQCPCSRATLGNLDRILVHSDDDLAVTVIASGFPESSFGQFSRWCQQRGVRYFHDQSRDEVSRFAVKTSGQILLYLPNGTLRFSGGITNGRGHEGKNHAYLDLRNQLQTQSHSHSNHSYCHPAYGCPLWEKSQ